MSWLAAGGVWYLFRFGSNVLAEQIRAEVEDNPVIVEHIGNVAEMEMEFAKSAAAEGDDVFVFRIEGDKGKGTLTVKSITLDDETEQVTEGTLKLDSGESFPLIEVDEPALPDGTNPADEAEDAGA